MIFKSSLQSIKYMKHSGLLNSHNRFAGNNKYHYILPFPFENFPKMFNAVFTGLNFWYHDHERIDEVSQIQSETGI